MDCKNVNCLRFVQHFMHMKHDISSTTHGVQIRHGFVGSLVIKIMHCVHKGGRYCYKMINGYRSYQYKQTLLGHRQPAYHIMRE